MNRHLLAPCLAACAMLALSACEDRRVTYPPDESRAADTDVQPAGATGDVSRPAASANPEHRCDTMAGQARQDCIDAVEAERDSADIRP